MTNIPKQSSIPEMPKNSKPDMIKVNNQIYTQVDDKSLLTYVCLIHNQTKPIFNSEMYSNLLVGNNSIDKIIRDGIKQLSDMGIIEIKSHSSLKNFVIQIGNIEENNCTYIEFEEVQKIMNTDFQINKRLNILRYFIGLVSTFNNGVGATPIERLSEITDINIRSINRYNKDIEDLGLIYIHHSDSIYIVNGHPQNVANRYSRPGDKDKITKSTGAIRGDVRDVFMPNNMSNKMIVLDSIIEAPIVNSMGQVIGCVKGINAATGEWVGCLFPATIEYELAPTEDNKYIIDQVMI